MDVWEKTNTQQTCELFREAFLSSQRRHPAITNRSVCVCTEDRRTRRGVQCPGSDVLLSLCIRPQPILRSGQPEIRRRMKSRKIKWSYLNEAGKTKGKMRCHFVILLIHHHPRSAGPGKKKQFAHCRWNRSYGNSSRCTVFPRHGTPSSHRLHTWRPLPSLASRKTRSATYYICPLRLNKCHSPHFIHTQTKRCGIKTELQPILFFTRFI